MSDRGFAAQLAADLEPDDVRLVLSVFERDVARLSGALTQAAAAGDGVAFRRAAHGLAGAAGAVGASGLERACRTAMVAADGDASVGAAGALEETRRGIAALADAALVELAAFVRGLAGGA